MNLLIVVIDSLRQDYLGCYGNDWVKTPNIDKLASESALFARCWSESLPTIPARRAMHTCRRTFPFKEEPRPKGVYNRHFGWRPLPEADVTLAEHLDDSDYVTALIADTYHIFKPGMNFHRYFDCFEWIRGQEFDKWRTDPLPAGLLERYTHPERRPSMSLEQYLRNQLGRKSEEDYQSPRVFSKAIEWLDGNAAHEKFVLWVESFDSHEPWEAPQKYVDLYDPGYDGREYIDPRGVRKSDMTEAEFRHVQALYAAEVTMVDHWVGKLLNKLDEVGRRDDTVVLLLSDHGKIIGEFDSFGMNEKQTCRALYAVPCMIRHPNGEGAGTKVSAWAYNIDAMATVLNLAGIEPLPGNEGIDLWPTVVAGDQKHGSAGQARDHLVCAYNTIRCVWQDDWLYLHDIDDESEQLYDLSADPSQSNNLAESEPSIRMEMAAKLQAVLDAANGQ